jgi:hypothetical protein
MVVNFILQIKKKKRKEKKRKEKKRKEKKRKGKERKGKERKENPFGRQQKKMSQPIENTLLCFSDIHGDFEALRTLLTQVLKVATYKKSVWRWTATNTTLVCLGDFVDRYRIARKSPVPTHKAISDQINILNCFDALQEQAKVPSLNSRFIVLMGNHELGNILNWDNYGPFQVAHPGKSADHHLRKQFVQKYLIPFACRSGGVILKWGNYFLCHAGLEHEWLRKHDFQSVEDVNRRWKHYVREGLFHMLDIFAEPESILFSRKMALEPKRWREQDKFAVSFLLGSELNPKFVIGHTTVQTIAEKSFSYSTPACANSENSSILSSRDHNDQDDIYFIDVEMSDGFIPPQASWEERKNRRPQALKLVISTDIYQNVLFTKCETLVLADEPFRTYDQNRQSRFE